MPTAIDVRANENAEYTNTVISKAADIIENMAATKQDWTAAKALKEADREFRNQNGHGEINFNLTALINSLNRHFALAQEEGNKPPQSPLGTLAPGCSAETAATTLREAAPKVAKYVHSGPQNRTDAARNSPTSHHRRRHQGGGERSKEKVGVSRGSRPGYQLRTDANHPAIRGST